MKSRKSYLMRTYGLYESEYDALAQAQRGQCAICTEIPLRLVVDHDHETGDVRGLLCSPCNLGLGSFRDQPDVLMDAADYLCRDVPRVKTARKRTPLNRRKGRKRKSE